MCDFVTLVLHYVGIGLEWKGKGMNEKGTDRITGKALVEVDPRYSRPAEVEQLLGDSIEVKERLGWNPRQISFEELAKRMTEHNLKNMKK